MLKIARGGARAALLAAVLTASATVAGAQDVAAVNPASIKVTLDNSRVRVMEATLKPGVKEQKHSHPASIVYVLAGGTVRNHAADGTLNETTYKTGQTLYREPLTHWAENIGKTTIRLIVVELKDR